MPITELPPPPLSLSWRMVLVLAVVLQLMVAMEVDQVQLHLSWDQRPHPEPELVMVMLKVLPSVQDLATPSPPSVTGKLWPVPVLQREIRKGGELLCDHIDFCMFCDSNLTISPM